MSQSPRRAASTPDSWAETADTGGHHRGPGAAAVSEAAYILMGVWAVAALIVLTVCRNSDRMLERKWHMFVMGALTTAIYLALPLVSHSLWGTAAMLSVCVGTAYALFTVFWTIPSVWLEARGAASGIALISSMGQFGGLLGPWSVGKLSDMTGSLNTGLSMAAILIGIGTLLATFAIPHRRLRAAGTD